MGLSDSVLLGLNKLFPATKHPFNSQSAGGKSYAEWQFENGARTVQFFASRYSTDEMFKGKAVLDIGCGAAGKSLYYASKGANVTGLEIFAEYKEQAERFAAKLGLSDKFQFVIGDATATPFEANTFDTIIANDAIEHISSPSAAITEALRVLKPGGRLYINFPPYYHPSGAHLTDTIYIPWVQLFFGEDTLIRAYRRTVTGLPDEAQRLKLRISADDNGREFFSYINKITIKQFKDILNKQNITPEYYAEVPLRSFFAPLAKCPATREMFVKMVVTVIIKGAEV